MHYQGQPLELVSRYDIQLPRPAGEGPHFRVQPLPLGFEQQLRRHQIERPVCPQRVARDSRAQPLRQGDGQVVLIPDQDDAAYRQAGEDYERRLAALIIFYGLQSDPRVEFRTDFPADQEDWRGAADALWAELVAAGFAAGDVAWLTRQICLVSNLLDQPLREARADFSPGGTVPPTPQSAL